jgi:hypothetical protein
LPNAKIDLSVNANYQTFLALNFIPTVKLMRKQKKIVKLQVIFRKWHQQLVDHKKVTI